MSGPPRAELRRRLEDAAHGAVRELAPPREVAGAALELHVEPADAAALGRVLVALGAARTPALVQGTGSKLWLGNPLRGARVLVSTRALAGIDELDASDGVVRAGAGTPLDALAEKVEAAGWLLPIDAPGRGGTLGGALASALAGPRRLGFGPVRDVVLGLDTVLADGRVARCGARVVKNVTGYDLAKLYVGSLGTLGVIERAWLRLRARPECVRAFHAALGRPGEDDAAVHARALACARRSTARVVALVGDALAPAVGGLGATSTGASRYQLVVELAGDLAAVERDAGWLATELRASESPVAVVDGLRALQTSSDANGVRVRLHALPSALAACCDALERGGARVLVAPLPGTVTAWFDPAQGAGEDPGWLERVLSVVDEARVRADGEAVLEALPEWARSRRDVFGGAPALSVMRALKQQFDPDGILNPGRFAGAI